MLFRSLVSAKIVDQAAREVLGDGGEKREKVTEKGGLRKIVFAVFLFLFCASGILYYLDSMTSVVQLARSWLIEVEDVRSVVVEDSITGPVAEELQVVKTEESESITIIPLEIVE